MAGLCAFVLLGLDPDNRLSFFAPPGVAEGKRLTRLEAGKQGFKFLAMPHFLSCQLCQHLFGVRSVDHFRCRGMKKIGIVVAVDRKKVTYTSVQMNRWDQLAAFAAIS